MSDDRGGSGFFGGFLLGAIVGGAVAAFLIQEETRDMFVGKAREATNFAMDASVDLRGSAAELYERGRQVVENARTNFDAAVDAGAQNKAES